MLLDMYNLENTSYELSKAFQNDVSIVTAMNMVIAHPFENIVLPSFYYLRPLTKMPFKGIVIISFDVS